MFEGGRDKGRKGGMEEGGKDLLCLKEEGIKGGREEWKKEEGRGGSDRN